MKRLFSTLCVLIISLFFVLYAASSTYAQDRVGRQPESFVPSVYAAPLPWGVSHQYLYPQQIPGPHPEWPVAGDTFSLLSDISYWPGSSPDIVQALRQLLEEVKNTVLPMDKFPPVPKPYDLSYVLYNSEFWSSGSGAALPISGSVSDIHVINTWIPSQSVTTFSAWAGPVMPMDFIFGQY